MKLESPRRPRSKIARTPTTTVTNRAPSYNSKTPVDPAKLQRSKSTGSVSTEPRSDGIPWRTAARASRLPYASANYSFFFANKTNGSLFSSGFPPKIPTRAFHSSEESIYGAAELQQQQQPLKENTIV